MKAAVESPAAPEKKAEDMNLDGSEDNIDICLDDRLTPAKQLIPDIMNKAAPTKSPLRDSPNVNSPEPPVQNSPQIHLEPRTPRTFTIHHLRFFKLAKMKFMFFEVFKTCKK